MEPQNLICTHMVHLNKKTTNQILKQFPNHVQCSIQHTQSPKNLYICLHCGKMYCGIESQFKCIQQHIKNCQNHYFYMELMKFLLYCKQCKDNLQTMIFIFSGNQKNPDFLRAVRFTQYTKILWEKWSKFNTNSLSMTNIWHPQLINLGNTCFLNVILQLLYATESLVEFYRKFDFNISKKSYYKLLPKDIQIFYDEILERVHNQTWHIVGKKKIVENKVYRAQTKDCSFNIIFKQFLMDLDLQRQKNIKKFEASVILKKLTQIEKCYGFSEQQDADELLILFLNLLSQGQMKAISYDQQRYQEVQKFLGKQKISITQNTFGSYLISLLKCKQCKKNSSSIDLAYQYPVQIKNSHQWIPNQATQKIQVYYHQSIKIPREKNTHDILKSFFNEQTLTKDKNYFICSNCSSLTASKRLFILSPPKILLISIKRFTNLLKNTQFIEFPLQLDISAISMTECQQNYKLYCVIVHEGKTVKSGHYICYLKKEDFWICCSDQNVYKVTQKEVLSQKAYILAYHKKQQ